MQEQNIHSEECKLDGFLTTLSFNNVVDLIYFYLDREKNTSIVAQEFGIDIDSCLFEFLWLGDNNLYTLTFNMSSQEIQLKRADSEEFPTYLISITTLPNINEFLNVKVLHKIYGIVKLVKDIEQDKYIFLKYSANDKPLDEIYECIPLHLNDILDLENLNLKFLPYHTKEEDVILKEFLFTPTEKSEATLDFQFKSDLFVVEIIGTRFISSKGIHYCKKIKLIKPFIKLDKLLDELKFVVESTDTNSSINIIKCEYVFGGNLVAQSHFIQDSFALNNCNHIDRSVVILSSNYVCDSSFCASTTYINDCNMIFNSYNIENSYYVLKSDHILNSAFIVESESVADSYFCKGIKDSKLMAFNNPITDEDHEFLQETLFKYVNSLTINYKGLIPFLLFNDNISSKIFRGLWRQALDDLYDVFKDLSYFDEKVWSEIYSKSDKVM